MSIRNRSSSVCDIGRDLGMSIHDQSGKVFVNAGIVDYFTFGIGGQPPPGLIVPGEVRTGPPFTWDQTGCVPSQPKIRCSAGTYTATTSLGEIQAAPVALHLL
jgi:hypothetical protein